VVAGLRACQFCGSAVDYVEPPAEEKPRDDVAAALAAPGEPAQPAFAAPADPADAKAKKPGMGTVQKIALFYLAPMALVAIIGFVALRSLIGTANFGGAIQFSNADKPADEAGATSAPAAAATDLGMDIYPGARPLSSPDRNASTDGSSVSETFVSSDEMDRVINFYKTKMVGTATIYASGNGVVVAISPSDRESFTVSIAPAQSGGKTEFTITHSLKSAS